MMRMMILLLQGASIFIAALMAFVFAASSYVPSLLVAVWAIMLIWWCRVLLEEYR
jgi:hypothetical protein